jgi:hypothetical protein
MLVEDSIRKATYQRAAIALETTGHISGWRRMLSMDASTELKNSSPRPTLIPRIGFCELQFGFRRDA